MVNFLPEGIYNKIKNIPEYKKIDKEVNEVKYACKDMAHFVVSDYIIKDTVDINNLKDIIKEKCTAEEIAIFKILYSQNRQEINNIPVNTLEDRMFKLIHQISFFQEDYERLIDEFTKLYEENNQEDFYDFIHIEYFMFKSRQIINKIKYKEGCGLEAYKELENILAKALTYTNDNDVLKNMFVGEVQRLLDKIQEIAPSIKKCQEEIDNINTVFDYSTYQYFHYSFNVMAHLDTQFDIAFYARDFQKAKTLANVLIQYIKEALNDRLQLMKGLNFYNKDHSLMFILLLYKWRQILNLCPSLNLSLNNLTMGETFVSAKGISIIDELCKIYRTDIHGDIKRVDYEKGTKQKIDAMINQNLENFQIFNFSIGG